MIHATAIVDPGAKIGANVEIGPYSIIGPNVEIGDNTIIGCLLYTSPSPRDGLLSRMPSSA